MEQYQQDNYIASNESFEPKDEYVCMKCGKSVGIVINGMCINCSNELENQEK